LRRKGLILAGCVLACSRVTPPVPSPSPSPAPPPRPAPPPEPAATLTSAPDARFKWGFWTSDARLIAATNAALYVVAPNGGASLGRTETPIARVFARNGTDRFVVESPTGACALRDATKPTEAVPIDHPGGRSTVAGAISPDGATVALAGCVAAADAASGAPRCGSLYDGKTGAARAALTTQHDLDDLAFTDDGGQIVARSADKGLTFFDASTGKVLATFPGWRRVDGIDAYNGQDLAEVMGPLFVVAHDETIELVDRRMGQTKSRVTFPGMTMAVLGPKTRRVAAMLGQASMVHVWDIEHARVIRKFALAKYLPGANCTHCRLEIDDADEDRLWVTSNYNSERFELRIGTGQVALNERHVPSSESVPSARYRVEELREPGRRSTDCVLARRDRAEAPRAIPVAYCNRSSGPPDAEHGWPYPGFDPSGAWLASISDRRLHILDVQRGTEVVTLGSP
jgi:hypothetical protein